MLDTAYIIALSNHGSLDLSQPQKDTLSTYCHLHEGKYIKMILSPPSKPRSNKQNNYLWGVVYSMIANETGNTTEEIHEFMKSLYLPRRFKLIGNIKREISKSTKELSTLEMESYLEQIRVFAAEQLHLSIPLPEQL